MTSKLEDNYYIISKIIEKSLDIKVAEEALNLITESVVSILGDKTAHLRPGGLMKGENQYSVSAVVMISPDRKKNIFLAQQNFPIDQKYLQIPINHGHPGFVVKTKRPLLLANTDEHNNFEQILKTSRMGSSIYAPCIWKGKMLGQLICGAQARNTYRQGDLNILSVFANLASILWISHGGPESLKNFEF